MKKTLVSALTTALVVGAASTTFAAANPFSDVPADHWAYDSISALAADGVIDGYPGDTFQGDNNMTRYEMAQIVAKAMAKTSGMSAADKAMVDKLAAEFSDELANLGVRVAALENKVDNVKWTGYLRYQYKSDDRDGNKENSSDSLLRLEPTMQINEHWSGHARLDATLNANRDEGSGDVTVDRVWAQGDYDNFTVKLGKLYQWDNASHGLVMDSTFSGVEFDFGKQVQVMLTAGRANAAGYQDNLAAANTYGVELRYVGEKFDIGAAYRTFNDLKYSRTGDAVTTSTDSFNIWNVGAGYRFSPLWYASADYAKFSEEVNNNHFDTSYRFKIQYNQMDLKKAGTYQLFLKYGQRDHATVNIFGNGDCVDNGFAVGTAYGTMKGWAIGGNVAVMKNVEANIEYFWGEQASGADNNIFYGQVRFYY